MTRLSFHFPGAIVKGWPPPPNSLPAWFMKSISFFAAEEFSMQKKLYIGNLSYDTNEDDLKQHFSQYGEVTRAQVIMDRDTNRSKGFAFVEMAAEGEAEKALQADGQDFMGRNIRVSEARPPQKREFGGGDGGRRPY